MSYNYQDEPSTLVLAVKKFLEGDHKVRTIRFKTEDLPEVPLDKVVEIKITLVSRAKTENRAE